MTNNLNKNKFSKVYMGVAIGFAVGAVFGVVIGILTKDISVWLAVGIGCGIATGVGIGGILDNFKKYDKVSLVVKLALFCYWVVSSSVGAFNITVVSGLSICH